MKIRTDFVTNSSSSSFILARKSQLNEKQKAAIIQFVEKKLLGEKLLTPQSTEEDITEFFDDDWAIYDEEAQLEIKKALTDGKSIYCGNVIFEECEYSLAKLYQELWKILENNGDGDFTTIDGKLDY